jgi:hypothetical protein
MRLWRLCFIEGRRGRDRFLNDVLADDRFKTYCTNANVLEGGPCPFNKNIKDIDQNLGVTQAAFNALAEDLQISM